MTSGREPWIGLKEAIAGVLTSWLDREDSPIRLVQENWRDLVGSQAAERTAPLYLRRNVLVVASDSSVWASELSRFRAAAILESVNNLFGETRVTQLRVVTRRFLPRFNSPGDMHDDRSCNL